MSRRIVFAGGVQTRALARIYRGEIAGPAGDDVVFVGTGAVNTEAARSTLLLADIVVMEADEDGDAIPAAGLPSQAEVIRVPNLYCDFLWPFAGRAHPKNRGQFSLPGGPYPAEHGDRFLDQMVADGVSEDEAIRRYLSMNIAVEGELDSRLTDRLAILEKLDRAGGYDLTSFIGDNFRSECLFRTRQRMTMPLLARLVGQLFEKLKVAGWTEASLKRVPFPAGAQPVHPGIIRHFGLTWTIEAAEYPVNDEGYFTFQEFSRRYMRFEWNEALHRGIQTARSNPAEAIADLTAALAISPDSLLGQRALAAARHAAGDQADEAAAEYNLDEESYNPADEIPPAPEAAAPTPDAPPAPAPDLQTVRQTAPQAAPDPVAEPVVDPVVEPVIEPAPVATLPQVFEPAPTAPAVDSAPAEPPAPNLAPDLAPNLAPETVSAALPPAPEPEKPALAPEPVRKAAPAKPVAAAEPPPPKPAPPKPALPSGFTDFNPAPAPEPEAPVTASPGSDLIEVLPSLLPVFKDLASAVDRPFMDMPEIMPPPPLRPVLPPELQGEPVKQGLVGRLFGRK